MVWLPDGEKFRTYVYLFWHDPWTWQTHRQTDTAWRHMPRLCIASRSKHDMHIQLSLSLHFYLRYLFNSCDGNDTKSLLNAFCAVSQRSPKPLTVSVGVSKLGCTELFFVKAGVKVDGKYCREVLLPVLCGIAGNMFVFQPDIAPLHLCTKLVKQSSSFS